MRAAALAVMFLCAGASTLIAQQAEAAADIRGVYWRPPAEWVVQSNWTFCAVHRGDDGWYAWERIQQARENEPSRWAEVVRPYVAEGLCIIARGGESLRIAGEQEDRTTGRVALIVQSPDGLQWFISPYAYGPRRGK